MSDKSSIEWTDATWNPIRGTKGRHHCVRISEGCKNCYAATMNHRFKGPDYVKGADAPRLDEDALLEPLKWKRPRRIFVCSMTDLFMDEHSDDLIGRVWGIMEQASQHTFQVLTKRSKRMREWVGSFPAHMTLPNVWLGVSAENQERADERIPDLLATPAAVRFVSAEPLLERVDMRRGIYQGADDRFWGTSLEGIDWLILGGESGPGARPCDVSWIRFVKNQCKSAGVPVFVKQLGGNVRDRNDAGFDGDQGDDWEIHDDWRVEYLNGALNQGDPVRVHLEDKKGGDPADWPADLRVREMPR